jgi:AcrR family transcriptional regulator
MPSRHRRQQMGRHRGAGVGVGVGTVYRHFPSLDGLARRDEVSMEIVALADPEDAPALLEGLRSPGERLTRLGREAFAIYERGARASRGSWAASPPCTRPSASAQTLEAALAALVDSALEPLDADTQNRAAIAHAIIDRPRHHRPQHVVSGADFDGGRVSWFSIFMYVSSRRSRRVLVP